MIAIVNTPTEKSHIQGNGPAATGEMARATLNPKSLKGQQGRRRQILSGKNELYIWKVYLDALIISSCLGPGT